MPSEDSINYYSNEMQVKEDTPPAILIHTNQDTGVPPENSIQYYLALRKIIFQQHFIYGKEASWIRSSKKL